jgi:hypothetical protein
MSNPNQCACRLGCSRRWDGLAVVSGVVGDLKDEGAYQRQDD